MVTGVVQGQSYCRASSLALVRVGCGYERRYGKCGVGAVLYKQKGKQMKDCELLALNGQAGEEIDGAIEVLKKEVGGIAGDLQGMGTVGVMGFVSSLFSGDNELVHQVGPAVSQLVSGIEKMRQVNNELVERELYE